MKECTYTSRELGGKLRQAAWSTACAFPPPLPRHESWIILKSPATALPDVQLYLCSYGLTKHFSVLFIYFFCRKCSLSKCMTVSIHFFSQFVYTSTRVMQLERVLHSLVHLHSPTPFILFYCTNCRIDDKATLKPYATIRLLIMMVNSTLVTLFLTTTPLTITTSDMIFVLLQHEAAGGCRFILWLKTAAADFFNYYYYPAFQ